MWRRIYLLRFTEEFQVDLYFHSVHANIVISLSRKQDIGITYPSAMVDTASTATLTFCVQLSFWKKKSPIPNKLWKYLHINMHIPPHDSNSEFYPQFKLQFTLFMNYTWLKFWVKVSRFLNPQFLKKYKCYLNQTWNIVISDHGFLNTCFWFWIHRPFAVQCTLVINNAIVMCCV